MKEVFAKLLVFIFLMNVCSCTGKRDAAAEAAELNIEGLTIDDIVTILADIHLAKSAARLHLQVDRDSMQALYLDQLYHIHDIDSNTINTIYEELNGDIYLYYEVEKRVHTHLRTQTDED